MTQARGAVYVLGIYDELPSFVIDAARWRS